MKLIKGAVLAFAFAFAANELPTARAASTQFTYFRSNTGVRTGEATQPDRLDAPEALRWRVPLDSGHSTPILQGSRILLTTYRADSKELATVALDEKTVRLLWRKAITPERVEQPHPIGNPATATDACDGQRLFVFFGPLV